MDRSKEERRFTYLGQVAQQNHSHQQDRGSNDESINKTKKQKQLKLKIGEEGGRRTY